MSIDYNEHREKFHDLKSQTASFSNGIKLLKTRIIENSNYHEVLPLMDESLKKMNSIWKQIKADISTK